MERTLLTWSVPNMITIWLMLIALIIFYSVVAQGFRKFLPSNSKAANNSGGY